jgi:hypothetical protein
MRRTAANGPGADGGGAAIRVAGATPAPSCCLCRRNAASVVRSVWMRCSARPLGLGSKRRGASSCARGPVCSDCRVGTGRRPQQRSAAWQSQNVFPFCSRPPSRSLDSNFESGSRTRGTHLSAGWVSFLEWDVLI